MNINIYLRGESEGDGVLIGTGNPDDFDSLIKAVQQWGCSLDGETFSTAVGQFFVHGKKAGFEVVVEDMAVDE
jgi:hypothetical protein